MFENCSHCEQIVHIFVAEQRDDITMVRLLFEQPFSGQQAERLAGGIARNGK